MLRKSANDIKSLKRKSPIVCLTAYTAPIARAIDEQVDLMLVETRSGWFFMIMRIHFKLRLNK